MDFKQCWTCGRPMTATGYNRYGEPRRWRCGDCDRAMDDWNVKDYEALRDLSKLLNTVMMEDPDRVDFWGRDMRETLPPYIRDLRQRIAALEAERDELRAQLDAIFAAAPPLPFETPDREWDDDNVPFPALADVR